MKTSITTKYQFLKSQLLELVAISNLADQKDHFFVTKFDEWLRFCESKLKELRVAEASHFSVYKAELIQIKNSKVRHRHKLVFSKSIESIKLAQKTLYNLFLPLDQKMTQAEEIIENILVLIQDTDEFKQLKTEDFSLYVQKVWQFINQQEVFQSHAQQLKMLLSLTDIKLLLGEKLTL